MQCKTNVIIIGELCYDKFVYGNCHKLAPEAPFPIFVPNDAVSTNWGMAGNVFLNAQALTYDEDKKNVVLYSQEQNVPRPLNVKNGEYPQILKTRYVDNDSNYALMRIDENDRVPSHLQFNMKRFLRYLEDHALTGKVGAIVIADYDKGFLEFYHIKELIEFSKKNNIRIFIDTKKKLGEWMRGASCVKMNYVESLNYTPGFLLSTLKIGQLIVTLGSRGVTYYDNTNPNGCHVPGYVVDIRDLSGAGDTFFAAFVLSYMHELRDKYLSHDRVILNALDLANRAAAIAVSQRGVVSVSYQDLAYANLAKAYYEQQQ